MKLLKRQLTLVLHDRLDPSHLDQLRDCLGLSLSGSGVDPVGTELGRRTEQHPKYRTVTSTVLALVRTGTRELTLTLDAIPGTKYTKWLCLAELGCRAVGFTIAERRRPAAEPPSAKTEIASPERSPTSTTPISTLDDATAVVDQPLPPFDPSIYAIHDTIPIRSAVVGDPERRRKADKIVDRVLRDGTPSSAFEPFVYEVDPETRPFRSAKENQLRTPPFRRSALEDDELVELAGELRNMVWSWRMDDLLGLGGAATFWSLENVESDQITMDTRSVPGNCYIGGSGGDAEFIDLPVATLTGDDNSRSQLDETFTRMTTALTASYGEPTRRATGTNMWAQWEGIENTLTLAYQPPSIRMILRQSPGITTFYDEDEARHRSVE
ncbi:DUF6301 family protein [Nocardia anaemiae]|uniref:DUF6301 family protein n=1 Tax=Nocardia anaemiae TaxID=263910 RepID=UPI0007A4FBA1|nr:DUF6301 family protein [Nocardia anaemiae]